MRPRVQDGCWFGAGSAPHADGHIRERDNACEVIQLNVTGVPLDLAILEADSVSILRRDAKDAGERGFTGGS